MTQLCVAVEGRVKAGLEGSRTIEDPSFNEWRVLFKELA